MARSLSVRVVRGKVLGIDVLRGFASIADLARISQADVYDAEKNPTGTQRDLNRRHAREAYQYVKSRSVAFFPEIILNARDDSVWSYEPLRKSLTDLGKLTIDIDRTEQLGMESVVISRVDGNHRLFFADGHDPDFPSLEVPVGFCLIVGLSQDRPADQELMLFRDINANHKGMNTSHLDNIAIRLASADLSQRDPVLFIAEHLMDNSDSPFLGRVYRGGVKPNATMIPLRNLRTSVEYLRQRSRQLQRLDVPSQSQVIKRYWLAVKNWLPEAWEDPGKYIALRSTGFWAVSFIGADVIDRAISTGKISADDMLEILRSGKSWNWSNSGDFRGFGGRAGATQIADLVTSQFSSNGPSIAEIQQQLKES